MAFPRSPKSSHSNTNPNCTTTTSCPSSTGTCKHSLVDLLFLLLLFLSSSFLITSVLSYLSRSLSLLLPSLLPSSSSLSLSLPFSPFFVLSFLAFFALAAASTLLLAFPRSHRRCHRPSCKALKRALEFDLQLQSEDHLRSSKGPVEALERLPWKGGSENNPDYECLRAELRRMAPVNGRAILLFREKCGCPVSKLVGWGPRKGPGSKKSKKALAGVANNRKGDHI